MSREQENNKVTLSGEIVSNFEFSHECYGEKFFTAMLSVERASGQKDTIPIMVSDRLVDVKEGWSGQFVKASGHFRSYNKHEGGKNHLELSVFVREFEDATEERNFGLEDENLISLDGYICKQPAYHKTPLGREVADIHLAINRPYGKTDYIPTICWGRNARFVSTLPVGARMQVEGRIQSREYIKKLSETQSEKRVAYEVSVSRLEVAEDEQSKD